MKGFKHTGRGPKYVKSFSAPVEKAVGGLVSDGIVEAPGFSDFKKGGRVDKRRAALSEAGKLLRKARGGKVAGVSNPMTPKQAMSGSVGFNRNPKIGK